MTWVLHPGGEARNYWYSVPYNTAQLREPGSCIPALPILSCYATSIGFPIHCLFQYIISHTVQYSKTFKHTYISLMSYGARSGLNFIQVIFPVLWRFSRVSWGSGFQCPASYRWSIARQNFWKTDRNNIVSMVVVKTIWCMYTFSCIKNGENWCSNFIFGTGNLQWCLIVPTKLQVRECVGCLNIRDLRCEVGVTVCT